MIASGQMGFDIQRNYIKKNRQEISENLISPVEIPEALLKDNLPESRVIQIPLEDNLPEETFKRVGKKLRLNQSAMDPDRALLAGQKLRELAEKSNTILLKVSTVWPFTFFKNDIIIDPYKVNIIYREFFWSEQIHSIMVKDILDVVIETSVFFATIRIVDQGYTENSVNIAYIKKDDALKVRKIIQGLVIAHRQAVDLSVLKPQHIKDQAEVLGQVKGIDDSLQNLNNR